MSMAPAAAQRPLADRDAVKTVPALSSQAMGPAEGPGLGPPKARISKKGRKRRKGRASVASAFPEPARPLQT